MITCINTKSSTVIIACKVIVSVPEVDSFHVYFILESYQKMEDLLEKIW